MGRLGKYFRKIEDSRISFHCPACDRSHVFNTIGWKITDVLGEPTVKPSLGVRYTKFSKLGEQQYKDFMETGKHPSTGQYDSIQIYCHTIITNGKLCYQSDCTHEYAGKTIPMVLENEE